MVVAKLSGQAGRFGVPRRKCSKTGSTADKHKQAALTVFWGRQPHAARPLALRGRGTMCLPGSLDSGYSPCSMSNHRCWQGPRLIPQPSGTLCWLHMLTGLHCWHARATHATACKLMSCASARAQSAVARFVLHITDCVAQRVQQAASATSQGQLSRPLNVQVRSGSLHYKMAE